MEDAAILVKKTGYKNDKSRDLEVGRAMGFFHVHSTNESMTRQTDIFSKSRPGFFSHFRPARVVQLNSCGRVFHITKDFALIVFLFYFFKKVAS